MSMKKSDLDKLLGKKVGGQMKVAGASGRFGQGSADVVDRREQRRLDAAAGLVPFAASCRPISPTRCARRAPGARTASTALSRSCSRRRSSERRRQRMSDAPSTCSSSAPAAAACAPRAWRRSAARASRSPRTRPLGGTCVNLGCIPKKLYSFAAHYAESFEEAHGFGWSVRRRAFDWAGAEGATARARSPASTASTASCSTDAGVTLLRGRARVVGAHEVEVGGARHRAARHPRRHRRLAGAADVPGGELAITLERDLRPGALPAAPGGGRRRLHRVRVRLDLQRPRARRSRSSTAASRSCAASIDDIRHFVAAEMRKKGVDLRASARQVARIEREADGRLRVVLGDGEQLRRRRRCSTRPAAFPTPRASASRRSA